MSWFIKFTGYQPPLNCSVDYLSDFLTTEEAGNHFAPYHFDQRTSGYKTILPSTSLGMVREFSFKEVYTEEVYSLNLDNGSLLVMGDYCQNRYVHSLPKDGECKSGRINITFREPDFK